jgi:hypothetical protein
VGERVSGSLVHCSQSSSCGRSRNDGGEAGQNQSSAQLFAGYSVRGSCRLAIRKESSMASFEYRVAEASVARVLQLIASTPNRRSVPITGDMPGGFDFWFDGGAGRVITGWTEYHLEDGTRATLSTTPLLGVAIKFPNGCCVKVMQVPDEDLRKTIREHHLDGSVP